MSRRKKYQPEQVVNLLRQEVAVANGKATAGYACERGMSERWACRLVNQPRDTQRYRPTQREDEDRLTRRSSRWPASMDDMAIGASPSSCRRLAGGQG